MIPNDHTSTWGEKYNMLDIIVTVSVILECLMENILIVHTHNLATAHHWFR